MDSIVLLLGLAALVGVGLMGGWHWARRRAARTNLTAPPELIEQRLKRI
jgi:uncharacterized iron-regulated membrane protein